MRVIKKYLNRKLYDTKLGKYTTLPEIVELVKKNENIQVISNKDKKDITNLVLKAAIQYVNIPNEELISIINLNKQRSL